MLEIFYCMETLDKVKTQKRYQIVGFCGNNQRILQRFFELGFTKGQMVKITAKSILKKVCLVEIRGYLLSVRTELLKSVVVK